MSGLVRDIKFRFLEEGTIKAADLKKVGGSVRDKSSSITETSVTFAGDFSGRQSHCHPERSIPNPFELAGFPVYLNRRPNYSSSPNSRKSYASNSSPGLAAADSSQSNASPDPMITKFSTLRSDELVCTCSSVATAAEIRSDKCEAQ
nr:hypothetical protein Itr_chr03CG00750 [Ipomoea trifida]